MKVADTSSSNNTSTNAIDIVYKYINMSTSNICIFHKAAMLVVFSKDGPNPISIRQALIKQGMSEDEARANRNRMKVRKEKQIIEGRIAGGAFPVPTGVQFFHLVISSFKYNRDCNNNSSNQI